MAPFSVSGVLILVLISCAFVQETHEKSLREEAESDLTPHIEFIPLRDKRYVVEPIQRLADSYHKGYSTKELKKTDITPSHHAEFIGSLAINGVAETNVGGDSHVGDHPSVSQLPTAPQTLLPKNVTSQLEDVTITSTSTSAPESEKPTKKPTDKVSKKGLDTDKTTPKPSAVNSTKEIEEDDLDSYPKDVTNNTLIKNNITERQEDNHEYYTSIITSEKGEAQHYWVDLIHQDGVIVNEMLSKSHRRAATVRLSFDFPFYGHIVRNMTVATGGFLYTGDYIHSWLAATQYIAPLMANFDTSLSEDSIVKYRDNGTSFTVEWYNVSLQDNKGAGKFTFQVTLHRNGDIVFVYKDIPILVDNIADNAHPVKVGLSDAYIIDKNIVYIRKKTIYEYHRVTFDRGEIKNWTVIYMKALPTCVNLKDCYSCLNHNTTFNCRWCDTIGRCSSGNDRFLQNWTQSHCPITAISNSSHCTKSTHQRDTMQSPSVEAHSKADNSRETRLGHSGVLGLFVVACLMACLGLWVFHAYRNPHTRFGQVLIKYRPSQWGRYRRSEARYTAASIHM